MRIPRLVAFDANGRAIATGCAAHVVNSAKTAVCFLPTDHYDFVGVDVRGMSFQEIEDKYGH